MGSQVKEALAPASTVQADFENATVGLTSAATVQADPPEQALSSIALERCWRIIQGLPERQHAVALLRWQLDMKESEIATVLGIDEKTVSVHLHRVRHKLIVQLGPDYPFDGDESEGTAS